MKLSTKQRKIINFIRETGSITVEQCQSMPGVNTYYYNGAKHCGNLLRNMARQGFLVRIKRGLYEIPENGRIRKHVVDGQPENQQQLF